MDGKPSLRDELRVLRQALPGALVLVVVLLLLRGYDGTLHVLSRQASMLAESFFGGPDVVLPVLLHTLPLALAAAVAAFAVSARWIRFESMWSIIVLSGMILAGTMAGGILRTLIPPATPNPAEAHDHQLVETPNPPSASPVPLRTTSDKPVGTVSRLSDLRLDRSQIAVQPASPPTVWEQLSQIDLLAAPDLTQPPPAEIAPIHVVPKISGILNVIGMAINQLLGFLVAYQPRLFLAAVIAGGWTGWRWQQRLQTLQHHVEQELSHSSEATPTRRAA